MSRPAKRRAEISSRARLPFSRGKYEVTSYVAPLLSFEKKRQRERRGGAGERAVRSGLPVFIKTVQRNDVAASCLRELPSISFDVIYEVAFVGC